MDVLSRIIYRGVEGSILKPLKVGSKEVVLSYLQFVDDTMFLCFGQRTPPLSLITFWGSLRRCQGLKLIGTSVRIWV